MIDIAVEKKFFPCSLNHNCGLVNVFSGEIATLEQRQDLLSFRRVGTKHLEHYINLRILRQPSSNAPTRKDRLLTMAVQKLESRKRFSQKES